MYLISIVTPTYLRDQLLSETIRSVMNQTTPHWEMLIVDDAQSESTEALVASYNDPRLRYFSRPDNVKGAPACRNIGINNAKGQYLMFLDSDDLMLPTCLEERTAMFQRHPEKDFLVFQTGFFTNRIGDTLVLWNRFDERDDLIRFLNADVAWHTSGSIFKRVTLLERSLTYNEKALTAQDWLFHIEILLARLTYLKIVSVPDVFVRRNPGEKRISDLHWGTDEIINRITLIYKILCNERVSRFPERSDALIKAIYREFFMLLNTKRTIPSAFLQKIKSFAVKNNLGKIATHTEIANRLTRRSFLLYRAYKKVFLDGVAVSLLNNGSLYRSPMSKAEIDCLNARILKHQ